MTIHKNTILFGGSGFFGPVILNKYPEIISVGRNKPPDYISNYHINLPNLDELEILDNIKIDNVIFLIGSSDHHFLNTNNIAGFDFNVYPIKKILSYFSKRKISKFLCFTTILLYDNIHISLPVNEEQPIDPFINEYVFSKYISEEIVKFYSKIIPSIIIRCSNIYGPTKLIRPDLIPTIIQNLLSQNEVSVWSKKPERDFIFLEDAADAIMCLLNSSFNGTVNLGTGTSTSIEHICNILENISGKKISDLNLSVSGPLKFCCDISILKKYVNDFPRHSINEGLEKTYDIMKRWSIETNRN